MANPGPPGLQLHYLPFSPGEGIWVTLNRGNVPPPTPETVCFRPPARLPLSAFELQVVDGMHPALLLKDGRFLVLTTPCDFPILNEDPDPWANVYFKDPKYVFYVFQDAFSDVADDINPSPHPKDRPTRLEGRSLCYQSYQRFHVYPDPGRWQPYYTKHSAILFPSAQLDSHDLEKPFCTTDDYVPHPQDLYSNQFYEQVHRVLLEALPQAWTPVSRERVALQQLQLQVYYDHCLRRVLHEHQEHHPWQEVAELVACEEAAQQEQVPPPEVLLDFYRQAYNRALKWYYDIWLQPGRLLVKPGGPSRKALWSKLLFEWDAPAVWSTPPGLPHDIQRVDTLLQYLRRQGHHEPLPHDLIICGFTAAHPEFDHEFRPLFELGLVPRPGSVEPIYPDPLSSPPTSSRSTSPSPDNHVPHASEYWFDEWKSDEEAQKLRFLCRALLEQSCRGVHPAYVATVTWRYDDALNDYHCELNWQSPCRPPKRPSFAVRVRGLERTEEVPFDRLWGNGVWCSVDLDRLRQVLKDLRPQVPGNPAFEDAAE